MIIRLLPILALVHTALAVYRTDDRPSFGEFSNQTLYKLPANGEIVVPDRSGFDHHVAAAAAAVARNRKNGVSRAAAPAGSDIMNICVGVASNPTRTKLFKDRTSCDIQGWNTLYTFQAFRNYDKFMAPQQMCVGKATGPDRHMMDTGDNCGTAGWTHDFTFWYNQCPWFKGSCDGNVYKHNMQVHVYEAWNPHRMIMAPGYDGTKHGWTYKWSMAYVGHYFALSSKGYQLIQKEHKPHLVKRADITTPTRSEKEALRALINCWTLNSVTSGLSGSILHFRNCLELRQLIGNNDAHRRSARIDNQNAHTVTNAFGLQSLNIQLQIGSNTYGNLLIPVNADLGASAIRAALLNCLETGVTESMHGIVMAPHVEVPWEHGHIEVPNMGVFIAITAGVYMMLGGGS